MKFIRYFILLLLLLAVIHFFNNFSSRSASLSQESTSPSESKNLSSLSTDTEFRPAPFLEFNMTKKKTQDSYVSKPKTDPSFVEAKSRMDEVYDDELTANLTVLWNLPKENYDDVELLDESEDHQTYLSRDQTGRTIERDYYDEELLSEEWDTADGGHVIRDFSHQTLFYFDPDGNRFDISFHENGAIASKGWQPKHGSGLSLSFKDDGTPEGIFEGTEDDGHYTALESQ